MRHPSPFAPCAGQPSIPPAPARFINWAALSTLALAASLSVLCSGCAEDKDQPSAEALCADLCAGNRCDGDGTLAQCKLNCERWYDLCPAPARTFYTCYNSQFQVDRLCGDDNRTRLADGLCVAEEDAFTFCLEGE